LRIHLLHFNQTVLQSHRIQLRNGKYADTALSASWTTRQPLTAASRGIGQSGIDNLNERLIPSRQSPHQHPGRIPHSPDPHGDRGQDVPPTIPSYKSCRILSRREMRMKNNSTIFIVVTGLTSSEKGQSQTE
jgi:hypothetical protein